MAGILEGTRTRARLHLPFSDGRRRAWLHEQGVVEAETQSASGFDLTVRWTDRQAARFRDM